MARLLWHSIMQRLFGLVIALFFILSLTRSEDPFDEERKAVILDRTPHNDFKEYFIPYMRDFEAFLCFTNYVVDKSLLIEKVMEVPEEIVMISAPPVFGKTLNLGMMRLFFEIDINDGVRRVREQNIGYRYFKRGHYPHPTAYEHKFAGRPLIRERKEFFAKHQGMYPVITLDLKDPAYMYEFHKVLEMLTIRFGAEFKRHFYLRRYHFSRIINRKNSTEEMISKARADWQRFAAVGKMENQNASSLARSIRFLCEVLYKFNGNQKVILLIDEMDYLIHHAKEFWIFDQHPRPDEFSRQVMEFVKELVDSTLRDNPYLLKTIITGETQSCLDEVFGDLRRKMKIFDALNNDLSEFYGFTKTVAKKIFKIGNVTDDLAAKAFDWYDGYRFNRKSEQTVISPWNVIQVVERKVIQNFWENGIDERLRKLMALPGIQPVIKRIINWERIAVPWDRVEFKQEDFDRFDALLNADEVPDQNDIYLALRRFYAFGYLTYAGTEYVPDMKKNCTLVVAPNKEVVNEMKTVLELHSKENPYTVWR